MRSVLSKGLLFNVGIIGAVTSILFIAPIFKHYAFTDTYEFLYTVRNDNFVNVFIQSGRPVYGLLNKFFLSLISSVDQLGWIRLFGVAGIFLATSTFFFLLQEFLLSKTYALLCALFFLFTPSAAIVAIWMATYQIGWAITLALWAGYLLVNSYSKKGGLKIGFLFLAYALGLISLMAYQSAFTAFVIRVLLYFLKERNPKYVVYHISYYGLIYVGYFIVHKITMAVTSLPPLSRTSFTENALHKILWFFNGPIRYTFYDNFLFYPYETQNHIALIFIGFFITGLGLFLWKKSINTILISLLFFLGFLLCGLIPNLISSDNWISYRIMPALFLLKWTIIFYAFYELSKRFKAVIILVCLIGLILLGNTWYNINTGFVNINVQEYALIKSEIKRQLPELTRKQSIVVIRPDFLFLVKEGVVRRVITDEFGSLSTQRAWVPDPMIRLILREENEIILEHMLKVYQISSQERQRLSEFEDIPVLDVEMLYKKSHP